MNNIQNENVIIVKKIKRGLSKREQFDINFEKYVAYWRSNPHRFITEYLGLKLYDFQKDLVYWFFKYPSVIYVASRGLMVHSLYVWSLN